MNFLNWQGYDYDPTLHQENTSEILLETNGMDISSKRTRQTNIRLYFIKDYLICKELNTKKLSIGDLLSDLPSNHLQGRKLNKIKKELLGVNK